MKLKGQIVFTTRSYSLVSRVASFCLIFINSKLEMFFYQKIKNQLQIWKNSETEKKKVDANCRKHLLNHKKILPN